MRFQVPQFIDIEDKIFGPFTFKQFVYLAGGAGSAYALYKLLPIYISIFLILPILGLALALTFYKVNGKPFVEILQAWVVYTIKGKLFIWKQRKAEKTKARALAKAQEKAPPLAGIPKLTENRLSDISWSLDVLDMQKKDK
jgi:hypothetical protein